MNLPLSNPLRYRRLQLKMELLDDDGPTIVLNRPELVAAFGHALLDSPQEVLLWIGVDAARQVVAVSELFRGTVDSCLVHPRDVFRSALVMAPTLSGLFLLHNHPSGRCEPSKEDLDFFERVTEAGDLLQVPVLDCFVISRSGHWSREYGDVTPMTPNYTRSLGVLASDARAFDPA